MNNEVSGNLESSSERGESSNLKDDSHLLVIRLSAMGDVAMAVPVIRTLVATYPKLKITFLTREFFKPIFSEIPNVKVYEADVNGDHSGVFGLGRLAKELREEGIDAVADLHNVLRTKILKSVFYLFGIPVKQIDKGRDEKKALTREEEKVFKKLKSTHQRYADVFAALGYPIDLKNHQFPDKQKLSDKINSLIGYHSEKWIGIAPFAQHAAKTYPANLMEEVLEKLSENPKIKILLFGSSGEERKKLEAWKNSYNNTISIAGRLYFEEELELISNLDVMLSMDSGNGHLAAMYGVPVLTIWGVTHPFAGFTPFGQPEENQLLPDLKKFPKIPTSVYGNTFPEGYENAIASIPPNKILKAIYSTI